MSPDEAIAELTLIVDVPVGEGEVQEQLAEGIRTIIKESAVVEELKQSVEGPLKEVCERLIAYFPDGISKGEIEISGATAFELMVECEHQNEQAAFFHVVDGVYGNGAPSESYKVVRLSDGKVMDGKELANISGADVMKLIQKYGDDDQKEIDGSFLSDVCYLCPSVDSCKVLYLYGSHFWKTLQVPVGEISGFLTEEGKTLLGVKGSQTATSTITENDDEQEAPEEEAKPAEPGRGELGIFDLRGPVKTCKWKNVHGESGTYTFSEDGFWLTKNGQSIKKLLVEGIERDRSGRIVVGHFEFYEENYTYNKQGLVTSVCCDGACTDRTYDDDGFVVKEVVSYPLEMGAEDDEVETEIFNYTIVEKDEVGNWTKRKCRQGSETRTFEYY